jgi:hypothetical protein
MELVRIGSIRIKVYSSEHNPPHIHAIYNEYEIRINLKTLKPLPHGEMPERQLKRIILWLSNQKNRSDAMTVFKQLNPFLRN